MIHVHLVQRHGVMFHLWENAINGYQEKVLGIEECFLLIISKSLSLEGFYVVQQLSL